MLIKEAETLFSFSHDMEITLEANPAPWTIPASGLSGTPGSIG